MYHLFHGPDQKDQKNQENQATSKPDYISTSPHHTCQLNPIPNPILYLQYLTLDIVVPCVSVDRHKLVKIRGVVRYVPPHSVRTVQPGGEGSVHLVKPHLQKLQLLEA